MKKWTRLFALLLSLCLICTTGMSAMATEQGSDVNTSDTSNGEEDKNTDDDNSETPGSDEKEEVKKPYPTGIDKIEGEDPYVYTIRIFAGKQGSFVLGGTESGKDENADSTGTEAGSETEGEGENGTVTDENGEETVSGNDAGPIGVPVIELTIDPAKYEGDPQAFILDCQKYLQLNDKSKYYVMGIRESGRDNSMVGAVTVNGDKDFVVAYGLRGKMVNYTIRYVDRATEEELAPSRTYEGKVGDKPVVAYQYIDGYRPEYYNATKTLSEDETENVITFYYSVATNPSGRVIGSDGEIVTIIDDGLTVNIGQGDITDEGTTVIGGGGAGAGDGAGAGEGNVTIGDEPTPLEAPQQLIDLDDEDVPLAGNNGGGLFGTEGNASILGIPIVVFIMIGLVMAGGLWYAFIYKKKKKEQEETKS